MQAEVPGFIRVLNVNDNDSSRYVATKVLRRAGFEVVEAETGMSAVRQARLQRPHVAVLDVRLPDISGIDVCRTLKNDPDTAGILVVQTSASFVSSANKTEGLAAGADAYLAQPFEFEELVATIHSLLRGRRHEFEARNRAEALTQADQRKDEFLAMLAHELRNPLSAILTASRLLQTADAPPTPKLAATVERQAHHLSSLVEDLLDISRITHNKIQLKLEPLDLRDAVRRAVETCRPTLDRKLQPIHVEQPDAPLWVNGDVVRMEQVLGNLISNASKYSPDRGPIHVVLDQVDRPGGSFVRAIVRDHGMGIAMKDQAQIFDLFYQVDTSLARSQSGLGIGLTMARRLVDMHGGSLDLTSEGPGKGSDFIVEIPMVAAPASRTDSDHPALDSLEGARVLLVDDNTDACELMQMTLEGCGCLCTTAPDGGEALKIVTDQRFDVAVLDIGLPVLDGYQLAGAIVEHLGALRPKLIALTGYGRDEDKGRSKRAGFDVHLVKPIDPEVLQETIAGLLRNARRRLG